MSAREQPSAGTGCDVSYLPHRNRTNSGPSYDAAGRRSGRHGGEDRQPARLELAALMHRAFGIDVLARAHCGGRLRLIATLHDPAVIRKILRTSPSATRGRVPAPPHQSSAPPRPDRIGSGARRTPSCGPREVAFVLSRPVRRSIDGGGLSGLARRSAGLARSTREGAADVHCGSGSWGGQRPSLGRRGLRGG